ncbi:MAG: hypothetical protein ACK4OF_04600 [Aquificaceae bacterium]
MRLFLLVLLVPMLVFSVERKEGVSNKEIIERLVRLEEGQKAILQRFDYIDRRFEDINRRFEDINKRFEDINKQLDRITAIFTALVVAVIGFAYWDRRTIIKKAKEETTSQIEKEGKLSDLIKALRELAKTEPKVAEVLKKFNLL